ncbi:hypothetical protein [Streptomyces sp. CoH27]|uniref:hypothetical protein n=1 Tax=Streptomyces sp. CoH27 TaxID=2875763 RepID=UPI001CD35557|nr:hypothetical protein [Streptomyces sp. CoH27]
MRANRTTVDVGRRRYGMATVVGRSAGRPAGTAQEHGERRARFDADPCPVDRSIDATGD